LTFLEKLLTIFAPDSMYSSSEYPALIPALFSTSTSIPRLIIDLTSFGTIETLFSEGSSYFFTPKNTLLAKNYL
tara:strand:+ start:75 stop:296 length:222 start_codon:yes stop_codon:yes gene_type:complete